jgi:predicted amidohydrolase YtcJ
MRRGGYLVCCLCLAMAALPGGIVLAADKADTIYVNGPVITMDKSNRVAEAVAISGDKILKVGAKKDILMLRGPNTRVVDLQGKTMLPGFIDGHSHFPQSANYELYMVNLNCPPLGTATKIDDVVVLLKKKLPEMKQGEWLQGFNYNDLAYAEKRHPTRADLDQVSPDQPIFIKHVSGHLGVTNTKGLQLAGITKDTPDPQGGKIRKGPDGEPDGVLEGPPAQALLTKLIPAATPDQYLAAIAKDSQNYAAAGITTAQNGGSPSIDDLFMKALDNGTLKIRLIIWPPALKPEYLKRYATSKSGTDLAPNGMITLGAAKLFADGSPQGYTAYFSQPYYKIPSGKPADYRGFPVYPKEELIQRVVDLHKAGWQVAIHGNGDQAIDDILTAYEEAQKASPRPDARDIVVHAQFTRPDHIERMAKIGVVPSFFVTHTYFWGDIHRDLVAGPEKAKFISPTKAALDKKIRFSLHNDTPVTPISPIMDVYSAVNRITLSGKQLGPEQRIPVMRALRGVTIDSAYQHFQENIKGSIEPGKLADFVVLDKNPLKVKPESLKDLQVVTTIVGGKVVYQASL